VSTLLEIWSSRSASLLGWNPLLHQAVLAGFNANTDRIRRLDAAGLRTVLDALPADLRKAAEAGLGLSASVELRTSREMEDTLSSFGPFQDTPGGQAAIVASIVRAFGGNPIPFHDNNLPNHYVFEFERDGRPGRVIFSPGPALEPPSVTAIPEASSGGLDAAFLSGFHLMEPEQMRDSARHLLRLRELRVPVHLEYTAMDPAHVDASRFLLAFTDSLGADEAEARALVGPAATTLSKLVEGLRIYASEAYVSRFHLHLHGVQVSYLDGPVAEERRALLLASAAAASVAAQGTLIPDLRDTPPLREADIERFTAVAEALGADPETGFGGPDLVVVPSPIVDAPKRIVGLGDVLSSVAFLARARHLKAEPAVPDAE